MKKVLVLLFIGFTVGFIISCSEEETELRWENKETTNSASVYDIQWVPDDSGEVDTSWSGELAQDSLTSFKTVGITTGKGLCSDNDTPGAGTEYDILINGQAEITLDSGSSNTLTITGLQTK